MDREQLGREVRNVWVAFAKEQHDPKPAHLVGWDELDENNKEVDRRIGEHIAQLVAQEYSTLIQEIERLALLAMDQKMLPMGDPKWQEWWNRYQAWSKALLRGVRE